MGLFDSPGLLKWDVIVKKLLFQYFKNISKIFVILKPIFSKLLNLRIMNLLTALVFYFIFIYLFFYLFFISLFIHLFVNAQCIPPNGLQDEKKKKNPKGNRKF